MIKVGDFAPNRSSRVRLSRLLKGKEVILCGISALKYLELFNDEHFTEEDSIFVYATEMVKANGFESNRLIVKRIDDFDAIDYNEDWEIACSTLNQVVNDMLSESELMNHDALVESLANYYEDHGNFDEIIVCETQEVMFDDLKALAMAFY